MTRDTMDWIAVTVADTKGSAPREAGAHIYVHKGHIEGSIGGGALEWAAIQKAREMLMSGLDTAQQVIPLGPDLGQCCGGRVTLEYTRNARAAAPQTSPLWIWGAGHVGRAIAATMAPLQDRDLTLVDTTAQRMPDTLPDGVAPLVAASPVDAVRHAPQDADHLIATYSHDIDLALCDALLRRGFASCGLIGSATKWARFRARLASMGHSGDQIARIACPIGNPNLGKHPQAIAVGVAAALISRVRLSTGDIAG